jgi:CRISPR-associated endonuclease/helicase Cas3
MRPLPFSDAYAHPGDPLPKHLLRVAERAASCVAPSAHPVARTIAFLAGLFHDIGKATPFFQDYLFHRRKKGEITSHAKSGAALAWWYTGALGLPPVLRLSVFIAVLRHHGALACEDWPEYLGKVQMDIEEPGGVLRQQLQAIDLAGVHQWLTGLPPHPDAGFAPVTLPPLTVEAVVDSLLDRRTTGASRLRQAFRDLDDALRFLSGFGGLLAEDKIDAALEGARVPRQALPLDAVSVYKEQEFHGKRTAGLNPRRQSIAEEVKHTWIGNLEQRLSTLTAPTGSGKTLAILDAALAVRGHLEAASGYPPRILYCLPFTSVIDQNFAVFAAVLAACGPRDREDLLLKHHHLVDGLFRTEEAEYAADGKGQLLTETWQSELVVTTFFQLLNTLLSNRNANLKRAAQLSGAIVLMDEVQAVPLRYWQGLRHLFQAAARTLGTRFVLLTATRPLIFRPEDACELLPNHAAHFAALSRVRLQCHHRNPLTLEAFAERIIRQQQRQAHSALIILNRRAAVRELFQTLRVALPGHKLVALSTDLTPRDRGVRIRLIRCLLHQKAPLILVSTQLIEAGVDLSFPVVHRDLAPLDAIIQSAGRCNRHAAAGEAGEVHLWQLCKPRPDGSPGAKHWERVYDSPLIEATTQVLGERDNWEESEFLDLSQAYFQACWQRMDQEPVDAWLQEGDFERIQEKFQLIPDGPPQRTLFVSLTASDAALWEQYARIAGDPDLSPLDKDRQFRPMRRRFYERVIQIYGKPDPEKPIERLIAGPHSYSRETGFVATEPERSSCIF